MNLRIRLGRLEAQLVTREHTNQQSQETSMIQRLVASSGHPASEVAVDLPLAQIIADDWGLTVEQVFLMSDAEMEARIHDQA